MEPALGRHRQRSGGIDMSLDLHRDPAWFQEAIRHTAISTSLLEG